MADEQPDSRVEIYEKLEHGLPLSKLINLESLGNLLARFSHYLGFGMVALDPASENIGVAREMPRPCRRGEPGCEAGPDAADCPACGPDLPAFADDEKFARSACASGAWFFRARIDNMFEPVGYVVMGPILIATAGGTAPAEPSPRLAGIPVMSDEQANESALLLCTVLEEVVFANYQSYLFSKMHLQLSRENLSQVTEGGDTRAEDGYLDSGQFSSLF